MESIISSKPTLYLHHLHLLFFYKDCFKKAMFLQNPMWPLLVVRNYASESLVSIAFRTVTVLDDGAVPEVYFADNVKKCVSLNTRTAVEGST